MRTRTRLAGLLSALVVLAIPPLSPPAQADHGADLACSDVDSQSAAAQHLARHAGDPDGPDADGAGIACDSAPGTVTPRTAATTPSQAVTLDANPRRVALGQKAVTITVTGAVGQAVRLHAYTRPSTRYDVVRSGVIDGSGQVSWNITPRGNTRLYASVGGRDTATTTVDIAQLVSIRATSTAGPTYVFSGQVTPARGSVFVDVHRTHGTGAALVGRTVTRSDGTYRLDRRFSGAGTFAFWAVARRTADNAEGSSSRIGVAVRP